MIVIGEEVRIPGWVVDLESFRSWARSEDYPRRGWFCYLNGVIWVDLGMEQLFTHNQVKGEFAIILGALVRSAQLGRFFHDRTLLSNPSADLSCEPDGSFVSWDALRGGRVRLVQGVQHGHVEMEGTPDMVLEVVSDSSVRKDTEVLLDLYWRAGVPEYWLVDARGPAPHFQIFTHTPSGYVAVVAQGGWLASIVFGRSFQLTQQADPLGYPQYTLAVQP